MRDYLATLADPAFFGPLGEWKLRRPELFSPDLPRGEVALDAVPDTWTRTVKGPWTVLAPAGHELAPQGWKIHVAPAVPVAAAALARTIEYCVRRRLAFKVLSRLEYVWAVNGKYAPRPSSGKSLVIYPDPADPSELAAELAELHAGVPGPRVLGSHRIGESIVHLRYGGFLARYTPGEDGEPTLAIRSSGGALVPDVRGVVPRTIPGVPVPRILEEYHASRTESAQSERRYRITGALHFSNTGGVYRGVEETSGAAVVLKEARHHTGYDAAMADAAQRLARQARTMTDLAHLDTVPAVLETFTQGGSDFLAYEFADGSTLQEWAAARHPALLLRAPGASVSAEDGAEYANAVDEVIDRLGALVADVNAAGHLIGDLHPGNVIVTPDGDLRLIDLEAARRHDADDAAGRFVGATGFFDDSRHGTDLDRYGLAATELYLHNPVVAAAGYLPGALGRSVAHARRVLHRDEQWAGDLRERLGADPAQPTDPAAAVAGLLAGLAETWETDHGVFHGAPEAQQPFHDVSLGFGAPGSAYALLATGTAPACLADRYAAWLDRRSDGFGPLGAGLLDGWAGNIIVADEAGLTDRAEHLYTHLLRVLDPETVPLRLRSGLAGALALSLRRRTGSSGDEVERYADVLARRAGDELLDRDAGSGGLLDGRAGIALILGRAAAVLGKPDLLEIARRLLEREIDSYVPHPSGALFHFDGKHRILGYLDRGNAGTVLALAELRDQLDVTDERLARILQGACAAVGVSPGLYRGLAGGLAAAAQLARTDGDAIPAAGPAAARQAEAVTSFLGRTADGRLRAPGELAVRASSDYATGAAGIALALSASADPGVRWLPGVF
jgi:tRNA A-37 threonylcarbamoyl transferase component Bud32